MHTTIRTALALAAVTAATALPAAAQPPLEQICHHDTADGTSTLLTVPEQAAASHADNHPDDVPPVDGACDDTLPRDVLARATTPDPVTGEPVMLAEFVDANGSREPDAGDVIRTGSYPLDFDVTGTAPFAVAEHELVDAHWFGDDAIDALIVPNAMQPNFRFTDSDLKDGFSEHWDGGFSSFDDHFDVGLSFKDVIYIEQGSPSAPTVHAWHVRDTTTDDDFLDVTIVDH